MALRFETFIKDFEAIVAEGIEVEKKTDIGQKLEQILEQFMCQEVVRCIMKTDFLKESFLTSEKISIKTLIEKKTKTLYTEN